MIEYEVKILGTYADIFTFYLYLCVKRKIETL